MNTEVQEFIYFLSRQKLSLDDVQIASSRGYWELKELCPGGERCKHAFRGYIGPCSGGGRLSIHYATYGKRDGNGRFLSPYLVWDHFKILEK
jgi:hypothetical protein